MSPRRKAAPKETGAKGWINRAYIYGERHVATVALVALGLGVVLSAAAVYGFYHEGNIETRVTREVARVESKCQRYGPHSLQCRESFGAALKSLNETLTPVEARIIVCRSHLFDQLGACKKVRRIEAAETQPEKPSAPTASVASAEAPEGGDANSTPSTGHSQPGRHEGGSSGGGSREVASGGGGHKKSPENLPPSSSGSGSTEGSASPAPTAPSSPGTSSSQTTERTTETVVEAVPPAEAPPPVRSATGALVESVGGVVEETGATVNGTVEGVTGTTCSLAKLLCP